MRYYPESVTFSGAYSFREKYLLKTNIMRVCKEIYDQLAPLVGMRMDTIFRGLRIEFTDVMTPELTEYNAIGLSWRDRNVNLCPSHLSKRDLEIYSGVSSMELSHSLVYRLTDDFLTDNDLVHFLWNEGYVNKKEYWSALGLALFHSPISLLIPDMKYGWEHQDEIMAGIRNGTYNEGPNEYFSDPAFKGPLPALVKADERDLEIMRQLL